MAGADKPAIGNPLPFVSRLSWFILKSLFAWRKTVIMFIIKLLCIFVMVQTFEKWTIETKNKPYIFYSTNLVISDNTIFLKNRGFSVS